MSEFTTRAPNPRRWRILALAAIAQLMLVLDVTVVAIALPHVGADLDLGREALTWVVSGYTLAFGGLLLLGGRAADKFGARRLILVGLALFTAASLTAGLSVAGPMLLAGRVVQGIAAALLSPAALSLVVTIFEGDERNKALGIWSALGGGGAALGVLLGGLLTAGPGWAWVFFINVPIGLILLALLRLNLPDEVSTGTGGRLDIISAVLVTAATGSLIYALIGAGDRGWASATTLILVGVSAALYAGFVLRQRRASTPLMDVRLLTRRPVATGTLFILVATVLMITVFFLGTFYLQDYREFSALTTGLLFLPVALATMVSATAAGRIIGRAGPRALGVGGLLLAAIGMAVPAIWDSTLATVIGMTIAGAGTGVAFVVASATALGQVQPHEAGIASGIVSTFHEFGASIGAATVSSMAAASIAGVSTDGFNRGFTTAAIVAVVAAAVAIILTPRPQQAVSEGAAA